MSLAQLAAADVGIDSGVDELGLLAVLLAGVQGYRGVIHGVLRSGVFLAPEF
jgi:hypothetical protein